MSKHERTRPIDVEQHEYVVESYQNDGEIILVEAESFGGLCSAWIRTDDSAESAVDLMEWL